jgi:hypothetical protein
VRRDWETGLEAEILKSPQLAPGITVLRRPATNLLFCRLFVVLGVVVCVVVGVAHVKWSPTQLGIKTITIVRPVRLLENVLIRKRSVNVEETIALDRLYFVWRKVVFTRSTLVMFGNIVLELCVEFLVLFWAGNLNCLPSSTI